MPAGTSGACPPPGRCAPPRCAPGPRASCGALHAPRALREHDDDVPVANEPHRGLDRLRVALAAPHRKRPAARSRSNHGGQKSSDFAMKWRKRRGRAECRAARGRSSRSGSRRARSRKRGSPFPGRATGEEPAHRPAQEDDATGIGQRQGVGDASAKCSAASARAPGRHEGASGLPRRAMGLRPSRRRAGGSSSWRASSARKRLVTVESPAKAKTIAGYSGARLRGRAEHRAHP